MAEVHLIVNDKLVDLLENESISQSWSFTDLKKLETTGEFTRQFRIPYTGNNIDIFGPLFDVNVSADAFHTKLPAQLSVGTLPISRGHVRVLQAVSERGGQRSDLEVTFYGETPDLSKALGQKKLSELTALSSLNHVVDYDAVTGTADQYRYALIDRGMKFSELGEMGTRQIFNSTNPVYPAELTPCVFWSWILEQIFSDAEFELDNSQLSMLEGYVMPWINSRSLKYTIPPEGYFFRAGLAVDQTTVGNGYLGSLVETYDNNNDFASNIYTAPLTGQYTFKTFATVTLNNSVPNYVTFSFRDPTDDSQYSNALGPLWMVNGVQGNYAQDITLFLNAGDQVRLYMTVSQGTVNLEGNGDNDYSLGTGWGLIGFQGALFGETIDMPLNAPDMLQIDFVKDVIAMHNCAFIPDRNIPNKVAIVPMANYLGTGAELDWTHKLDIHEKDIVVKATTEFQSKKLKWTYKTGGDVWSKLFEEKGQRTYGEYAVDGFTVTPTDTPSDFAQGENTVTLVTQSTPCNTINGTNVVVPKFVNENGDFVEPGPRCLFLSDQSPIQLYDDDALASVLTNVNLVNHYSDVVADVDDFDLNFAPETPAHNIQANPYNNLFNLYWRDYMNGIYSPQARMMEAYFALDLIDVMTFSFADEIFIKDSWWRILEISDYKVGQAESTKVVLIKVISPSADCTLVPVGSLPSGAVVFHDRSGIPQPATQECCVRYGFVWSVDTCYALGNSADNIRGFVQQTNGIGVSPGETSTPNWVIRLVAGLNSHPSNIFSIHLGYGHTVPEGNDASILVGDHITVENENRTLAAFGKNILANMPGLYVGGGWIDDDRSTADGVAQYGVVMMSGQGTLTNDTDTIEVLVEGKNRARLNTLSSVNIVAHVVFQWTNAGSIYNGQGTYTFSLRRDTVARVQNSDTIQEYSEVDPVSLFVSTSGQDHIFYVKTTDPTPSGYPMRIAVTLHITQTRLESGS